MMLRRRMPRNIKYATYITDGLVFWLDGINKGDNTAKWKDLIGQMEIDLFNTSLVNNGVVFDGTTSYGYLSGANPGTNSTTYIDNNIGTIECCIDTNFNNTLTYIIRGDTSSICLAYSDDTNGYQYSASRLQQNKHGYILNNIGNKKTISINSDRALINGQLMQVTERTAFGTSDNAQTIIGTNSAGYTNKFNGIIHSIRIYNRKLTQSEMLNNNIADNYRFNLGLNI